MDKEEEEEENGGEGGIGEWKERMEEDFFVPSGRNPECVFVYAGQFFMDAVSVFALFHGIPLFHTQEKNILIKLTELRYKQRQKPSICPSVSPSQRFLSLTERET